MRRLFAGLVVAAAAALVPAIALAGNQEVADQIAKRLHASGQLHDYKIGVKFQDGTAWLRGEVCSQEQMSTAMRLALESPGVNQVKNELAITQSDAVASADRVPSTFVTAPAQQTAAQQMLVVSTSTPAAMPRAAARPMPLSVAYTQEAGVPTPAVPMEGAGVAGPPLPMGQPAPAYVPPGACPTQAGMQYDQPNLPNYAWPSYAAHPNYAALAYPRQYSPTAWPYIGPFYPYPQVPLGWRKVTLEWDDGWWFLDFKDK